VKRGLVFALFALGALSGNAAAQSTPRLALFPTPLVPLTPSPPYPAPPTALPNLFRPPISSRERIAVGIDETGDVVSVEATQRLVLGKVGDYRLTVPAPATDVVAAPESESSPGLRKDAVLWAGFSDGRKILASTATLEPATAAKLLPLDVTVADGTVRLANVTSTRAATFSARANPKELAGILTTLRRDPEGRALGRGVYLNVRGDVRETHLEITAPLRVTGRVGARAVSIVLGGDEPTTQTIRFTGRPSLHLSVEPIPPRSLQTVPNRPTWNEAVRISLTLARSRQYRTFLANPDPLGIASARYVYRTVAASSPVPPPSAPSDEGLAVWLVALIAAAATVGAAGLTVLWANS
jgi:hypothetical protein